MYKRLARLALLSTVACGSGNASSNNAHHDVPSDVTFGQPAQLSCGGSSTSIVYSGDFNGDHQPDLLVRCADAESYGVFLNVGGGVFGDAKVVDTPLGVLEIHDIDGDGDDDLVFTQENAGAQIMLSNGDGTFVRALSQSTYPYECAVGKYSFDGNLNAGCWAGDSNTLTVYDVEHDGSTQQLFTMYQSSYPYFVDVDGDGNLDLVYPGVTGNEGVDVRLGLGGGSFGLTHVIMQSATAAVQRIAFGDVDGDGLVDMVVDVYHSRSGTTHDIVHNEGSLVFTVWNQLIPTNGVSDTFEDVTGDGIMDDVQVEGAQIGILVGNGDGTFNPTEVLIDGPWTEVLPLFKDLNGDGKPDVTVAPNNVFVLLRQ